MSTIICQNLISCIEPQLAETTTTLKLRVAAAPPPAALEPCRRLAAGDHLELGSWGFLQNNLQESSSPMNKDCSYTHPLSKNSKLSPKSLELCTENLGSESGSDTFSDCSSIFSASPPLSPTSSSGDDHRAFALDDCRQKMRTSPTGDKYCRKIKNFPPPLTTMSGASSLQVRRRSDGGRLIIDAVEGPFRNSYLHAERSDGRLKLCFTTAAAAASGGGEEESDEAAECGAAEGEIEEPRIGFESEKEELDGEMNLLEKFQRFSRCKEGGGHGSQELCSNWKPATLWVATS
ncbi:protein FANTASTIC FOUR 2 [Salvia miltiorrhiza]|uniref:protein FANTASTIC FOUR 2 n=1 Tax=Salvia miltiorrhiza TaxID=226208 RepID=UPI0025AC74B9|nr:protein FANTASTIC FOUR 2 [Salvia miltiorrhiza]